MTQSPHNHMLHHAVLLYQVHQLDLAEQICRDVFRQDPHSRDALKMLVNILLKQGRRKQAFDILLKACKRAGKDAELFCVIGVSLKNLGEPDEAKAALLKALVNNPRHAEAAVNLARIYADENSPSEAKRYFLKALGAVPDLADAMAGLADILARENDTRQASGLCQQVLKQHPGHYLATLVTARMHYRCGRYQDAIDLLAPPLTREQWSGLHAAVAHEMLAKVQDRAGNYAEAFESFRIMNDAVHAVWAPERSVYFQSSVYSPDSLYSIYEYFRDDPFQSWAHIAPDDGRPAPVFMVGFPRSGTTMLDQVLASHSHVWVVEEKENLQDIYARFASDQAGLERLAALQENEIRHYRKLYWKRLMQEIPVAERTSLIVDKVPLNTIMLGFICRFFPEAKIIFVLRDPRDACLSCYQQNFVITEAMFQFLKPETTVAYYDAVMRLGDHFRKHLPLLFHTIRYEDVVNDFEKTLRPLMEFLGLEWEENIIDFQATAKKRLIRTPSAEQVLQPVYQSSVGRWKNYVGQLYPCWELLDRWVDTFGYPREC